VVKKHHNIPIKHCLLARSIQPEVCYVHVVIMNRRFATH